MKESTVQTVLSFMEPPPKRKATWGENPCGAQALAASTRAHLAINDMASARAAAWDYSSFRSNRTGRLLQGRMPGTRIRQANGEKGKGTVSEKCIAALRRTALGGFLCIAFLCGEYLQYAAASVTGGVSLHVTPALRSGSQSGRDDRRTSAPSRSGTCPAQRRYRCWYQTYA